MMPSPDDHGTGIRLGALTGAWRDGDIVSELATLEDVGVSGASAPADVGIRNDKSATRPPASHALPPEPGGPPRRRRHTSRTTWKRKAHQNSASATSSARTNVLSFCRCVRCHFERTT